jgi:hypothetical protein
MMILLGADVELLGVLHEEVVGSLAVVQGRRELRALRDRAVLQGRTGDAEPVCPGLDLRGEAQADRQSAARDDEDAGAVPAEAPLALGLRDEHLHRGRVGLVGAAGGLVLGRARPVVVGQELLEPVLAVLRVLLALLERQVLVEEHLGVADGLRHHLVAHLELGVSPLHVVAVAELVQTHGSLLR